MCLTPHNTVQFHMPLEQRQRLEGLPWTFLLEEWPNQGVIPLSIRRGESRHPVIFVERQGTRYAIKETSPYMAEREIRNMYEIEARGIPALSPVGWVVVSVPPIQLEAEEPEVLPQYISGDRGYTVTQLAPRVVPHALLYSIPFTRKNKRRLLSAVAVLLVELHEHGVYWGDPSLANILIRLDGRRILAIMADAETAELFPGPVSEGLREQDLASFGESLIWQSEDLRLAQGLPEDAQVLDDADFHYFERRYRWLCREHGHLETGSPMMTLRQAMEGLNSVNRLGFSLLDASGRAVQQLVTVRPGWHQRRIRELLGITIPRVYARRFYNTILSHQATLGDQQGHKVSIEEAAKDWYTRYHLPLILLLRQHLGRDQDPMKAYFEIIHHKWELSSKAGHEVPMDEALLAWAMEKAEMGQLGMVDPASLATWWREREPVMEALEPLHIESRKLEPLLSQEEQPLVHLSPPDLEQELEGRLEHQQLPEE
jgi:hypothetical protein